MPDYPRKLRAVAAAGVLTVALALPIGVAAAAEHGEPTHGESLGGAKLTSPLAPATEVPAAPSGEAAGGRGGGAGSGGEAGSGTKAGSEAGTGSEGGSSVGESVTENAPLTPEAIRHPKIPPASGGTLAEETGKPNKGEEELAEAETEEE